MKKDLTPSEIPIKAGYRSSIRLLLTLCLILFLSGAISIFLIYWRLQNHALKEAQEKAMILLDRNMAVHTYFSHQLKPALFKKMESILDNRYFEPAWMSSTYAVREIDTYYQAIAKKDYYYKECAINARSPENEADEFERLFIEKLNSTTGPDEFATERTIDGEPFFVVLRRGETMEKSCLRCHSTPVEAPGEMVDQYGPDRSFNRFEGEVVSAVSIRIPLNQTYSEIHRLIFDLSLVFVATLLAVFSVAALLSKRWVFDPLGVIRLKAAEISKNPESLGDRIELPPSSELAELTQAFNLMSFRLKKERDGLENRVAERTRELHQMNAKLREEGEERQKVISELQTALAEVRTLRGILPICSHCKKIRDDNGYWNMLESYIHKHSEADFSHGICPECAKKYYPDLDIYGDSP